MAIRNQPYFPLYVQDFLTDEKLRECSAKAVGVYIFIMCVMHKSETYGTILLKQKDKQTDKQIDNFAMKLARHLPYDINTICYGIQELVQEKVLLIEEDCLIQKRMVKDQELSNKRSLAGKKGQKAKKGKTDFAKDFAQAKSQANPEYEYEYENEVIIDSNKIPSLEEFLFYCKGHLKEKEFLSLQDDIKLKYHAWLENDWKTGGKKPRKIVNWKTTLLNTLKYLKSDIVNKPETKQTASASWRDKIKPIENEI